MMKLQGKECEEEKNIVVLGRTGALLQARLRRNSSLCKIWVFSNARHLPGWRLNLAHSLF